MTYNMQMIYILEAWSSTYTRDFSNLLLSIYLSQKEKVTSTHDQLKGWRKAGVYVTLIELWGIHYLDFSFDEMEVDIVNPS